MKRLFLISASIMIASSAFAQSKCVTAPVTVTSSPLTITSSGNKTLTKEKAYLYYGRKHRKHQEPYPMAGLNDNYPSTPLLLSVDKQVSAPPETYNVSLSTLQNNVSVCPDSTVNIAANINIEKVASYTGNYPGSDNDNKQYTKVSKHKYKMAARKIRKIKRDEMNIERRSCTKVDVKTDRA